jgi:hypothetical protein
MELFTSRSCSLTIPLKVNRQLLVIVVLFLCLPVDSVYLQTKEMEAVSMLNLFCFKITQTYRATAASGILQFIQ